MIQCYIYVKMRSWQTTGQQNKTSCNQKITFPGGSGNEKLLAGSPSILLLYMSPHQIHSSF